MTPSQITECYHVDCKFQRWLLVELPDLSLWSSAGDIPQFETKTINAERNGLIKWESCHYGLTLSDISIFMIPVQCIYMTR